MLLFSPFTFFLDYFGTDIANWYLTLNYWGILVGGGAFQVVSFILWIVATTVTEIYEPLIYVAIYTAAVAGMYMGYMFLRYDFYDFYVQMI